MENPAGARNTSRVTPANVVTPVRGQQMRTAFFCWRGEDTDYRSQWQKK